MSSRSARDFALRADVGKPFEQVACAPNPTIRPTSAGPASAPSRSPAPRKMTNNRARGRPWCRHRRMREGQLERNRAKRDRQPPSSRRRNPDEAARRVATWAARAMLLRRPSFDRLCAADACDSVRFGLLELSKGGRRRLRRVRVGRGGGRDGRDVYTGAHSRGRRAPAMPEMSLVSQRLLLLLAHAERGVCRSCIGDGSTCGDLPAVARVSRDSWPAT